MTESRVPDEFHVGDLRIVVKAQNIGKVKPRKRYIEFKDFGENLQEAFDWGLSRCGPGIRVAVKAYWDFPIIHPGDTAYDRATKIAHKHGTYAIEGWISENADPWEYYFEYGWAEWDYSDYGDDIISHITGTNMTDKDKELFWFS